MSIFTDSGQTLEDFADTMYVCCPKCHKRAYVKRMATDEEMILANGADDSGSERFKRSFSSRKLSCLHCSYTRIWRGNTRGGRGQYDWYFGLPLWLQIPCCGNILWAFNEEHLRFLERYVMAEQRLKFSAGGQIRNTTMASRLPAWIKSAKNRDEILKGIARLKKLLETSLCFILL
ncbi:hypothetical protein KDA_66650 [Dictyobacter alpinus]|uniref:Uncharacterized protein n=1 Tax=Dictyobacter alpinus TaxID=2014873 RepID=A0A402BID9_9CHLR|nr:hypothetical protein KDA_66650 [Dictyobacter alpinus]